MQTFGSQCIFHALLLLPENFYSGVSTDLLDNKGHILWFLLMNHLPWMEIIWFTIFNLMNNRTELNFPFIYYDQTSMCPF